MKEDRKQLGEEILSFIDEYASTLPDFDEEDDD